jgi:hypothetical protein
MSDISFIAKKNGLNKKKEEKEEVKWSRPAPLPEEKAKTENKEEKNNKSSDFFSFFKKETADKKDIKNLREEVLRTIKENKGDKKDEKKDERQEKKYKNKEVAAENAPKELKGSSLFNKNFWKSGKKNYSLSIPPPPAPSQRWERPQVLETNLIEGEIAPFFNLRKNIPIFIFVISFTFLILAGAYFSLFLWEKQVDKNMEESKKASLAQNQQINIAEEKKKEIYSFGRKLELAEYLLNNHIYWTNFFEFLEKNTLKDVYYGNFSGDLRGEYSLPATTKNYSLINEQVKAFLAQEKVKEAKAKEGKFASAQSGAMVNFNLNLKINPNIFKNGNEEKQFEK